MNREEIKEIIDCLPKGRTAFFYFKDRYALLLLSLIDSPVLKRDLKRSCFTQLLDKPVVKEVFAEHRSKAVPREAFEWHHAGNVESYSLTLDAWGSNKASWVQTTRRGFNIVLQLNFSSEHNQLYRRLIDPQGEAPFAYEGHPVAIGRTNTLAWSRMDVDLDNGEALIEEIQTDWLRYAQQVRRFANRARGHIRYNNFVMHKDNVIRYFDDELKKHLHWDEAMLSATVWFLRKELGVRTIFYHTQASGAAIKRTGFRRPPRSIYSRLPRKFCFEETDERPTFMTKKVRTNCSKKAVAKAKFQVLRY